ncbi:LysE family translocator [Bacillus sp. B1-b2]|uniref:LysE family translocator n=1 Tax=Bacillus sp. B1-b2 TaxID=2653201 RepID=UPI0012628623|nr:LysE family transporter [Bacillus sp. B1-b2]KAB7671232.1 amino acid transporter [Bacillus sp. B1-b2]
MTSILYYIALGLSLAAPIGPINAAVINRGLRYGFFQAWILALGSILADVIYILLVYLGVAQLVNTPIIQTFLYLFGGFVLIYTGVEGILTKTSNFVRSSKDSPALHKSFITGFLMSFMNPLSIVFWLGIYGSVLASSIDKFSTSTVIFYTLCILMGVAIWDFTVSILSSFFRNMVSEKFITFVSRSSGFVLLLFGIYFGYQGVQYFL